MVKIVFKIGRKHSTNFDECIICKIIYY